MASEKAHAVVLRVIDFSETSCIVTLFTREFGKISALAKGARRPKGPFESALDLLAVCRIVFIHKSSDALDLLTEAKLDRRFRAATRDLTRLYAGFYVAELLDSLTEKGDPHPEIYSAAEKALLDLDGRERPAAVVVRFEMTLLRLLGHLPSLDACVECGEQIELLRRISFSQLAGGLLCPRCREGKRHVVSVSLEAVKAMKCLSSADEKSWRKMELDRPVLGELRGVLNHYLTHLVGRKFRLHSYLGLSTN